MSARCWPAAYLAASVLVLGALTAGGFMQPWNTPDTPSWLATCHGSARVGIGCFAGPRFPLYRFVYDALTLGGALPGLLPWAQDGLFLAAGYALARSARAAGLSDTGAFALALALPASNMLLIWGRAEVPEILARAALLGALAATVRTASRSACAGARMGAPVATGLLTAIAFFLDPGQLPFMLVLPVLALWLGAGLVPFRKSWRGAALLGVSALLPFLLVASLRLATLNDFNIVSFGGYDMSGMAAYMLTPATVARLPPDLRGAANGILARRHTLIEAGVVPPVPGNSLGHRSLLSETIGYFDILARFYDVLLRGAVLPLRHSNESWVVFNARMQRLAFATVRAQPVEYLAWVAAASARLVGRMLMLNLPFVLASAVAVFLALARVARPPMAVPGQDLRILLGLTGAYTIGSGALACLVAFPAQRYVDGTGLLISAWPIYAALQLAARGEASPQVSGEPAAVGVPSRRRR